MNRSLCATGSAVQVIKRRILKCGDVQYYSSFRSNVGKAFTDQLTEHQLCHSVASGTEICTRKDGRGRDGHISQKVLYQNLPFSNGSPMNAKSSIPNGAAECLGRITSISYVLKVNRKNRSSGSSARRRIQSGYALGVTCTSITQDLATSSVPPFLRKQLLSTRTLSVSAAASAILESSNPKISVEGQPLVQLQEPSAKKVGIRERLRIWEIEHPVHVAANIAQENLPSNISIIASDGGEIFDGGAAENEADSPFQSLYEEGELVDLGDHRPFLRRGDMVELRNSNNSLLELAIFVRMVGKQSQYYTMSGKWIHQKAQRAKFCVPSFVEANELDPLLSFLPEESVPEVLQNKLQSFEHALPREVGSPLIKKMLDFWKTADRVFLENAHRIDAAHQHVAHESNIRYASLIELANELLLKNLSKSGDFPITALYALHRGLMQDSIGFHAQDRRNRTTAEFEISSINEREMINEVSRDIRRYQAYLMDPKNSVKTSNIERFLRFREKACHIIQESRMARQYTTHGIIGPAKPTGNGKTNVDNRRSLKDHVENFFVEEDQRYIRFIECWAALRTIPNHSHLYGTAAAIVRATGMYDDTIVDQRVGWTFLQEIGAIAPWESRARFDMRLPNTSRIITQLPLCPSPMGIDALEGLRKDWGNLPVYCIDDIGAKEIDDGVSIEPTDLSDEYWIHVHTADPASKITPRTATAQHAEFMLRTVYLPETVLFMLPKKVIQEHTLAPNRSCLTFSARMNFKGEILDIKITPGIVRNVMYITPATLSAVVGENRSVEETIVTVGDSNIGGAESIHRLLLQEHEIVESDKINLRLLHALGIARQSISAARGSFMVNRPSVQMSVAVDKIMSAPPNLSSSLRYQADPKITLRAEKWGFDETESTGNTVMSLMLLAGEVAARWCHERGIPIINRISLLTPGDPDPRDYFRQVIMPLINRAQGTYFKNHGCNNKIERSAPFSLVRNFDPHVLDDSMTAQRSFDIFKTLPPDTVLEYQRLLGAVIPSTAAGPHLHLGLDMFTRATSPLRRYGDLLTHWQIEAALLEEARSGQSLIGSTRDDFLPFKKDELDRFMPRFDSRERQLIVSQRNAQRAWAIQLLLRAWKFNEAPLPATFELLVQDTQIGKDRRIRGDLVLLGNINAEFSLPDWIPEEEVKIGDVFEVRLVDMDVYRLRIYVEPVRRLESWAERISRR